MNQPRRENESCVVPVTPSVEDVHDAIRRWYVGGIEGASSRIYESGRFLSGVSVASIGLFVTISKFTDKPWSVFEAFSLILLGISAVVALRIAIPAVVKADDTADLQIAHTEIVRGFHRTLRLWMIVWLASVGLFVLTYFGVDCLLGMSK